MTVALAVSAVLAGAVAALLPLALPWRHRISLFLATEALLSTEAGLVDAATWRWSTATVLAVEEQGCGVLVILAEPGGVTALSAVEASGPGVRLARQWAAAGTPVLLGAWADGWVDVVGPGGDVVAFRPTVAAAPPAG